MILKTATALCAVAFVVCSLASCITKGEVKELGKIVAEDLRNAYIVELDSWAEQYADSINNDFCGYFIYDNGVDSIPQLWVLGGTCEADRKLAAYTYDLEGALEIYSASANHATLYEGEGCILSLGMNNGEALLTQLTSKLDTVLVDTLFMGKVDENFQDPAERRIELLPYSDREPIESLLENLE